MLRTVVAEIIGASLIFYIYNILVQTPPLTAIFNNFFMTTLFAYVLQTKKIRQSTGGPIRCKESEMNQHDFI